MPRTETTSVMHWATQTRLVNEAKSPNSFLTNLLYPRSRQRAVNTETIEMSFVYRKRQIAPFVERNGKAIMVPGGTDKFATIMAPNIRISHPLNLGNIAYRRLPGTDIFPGGQAQQRAIREHVARQLRFALLDSLDDTMEYMVAASVRGQLTYETADEAVFQITYPRPASHNATAATLWSAASGVNIKKDVLTARRLVHDEMGSNVTDIVLGSTATDAFLNNTDLKDFLDANNYNIGSVDLTRPIRDDGALLLGTHQGIRIWSYTRTVELPDGTSYDLIRPGYAEFFANTARAEFEMKFASIPDWHAFQSGNFVGRRFSKNWLEQDPSTWMALVHSRPLPCPRRPGAMLSMQVV